MPEILENIVNHSVLWSGGVPDGITEKTVGDYYNRLFDEVHRVLDDKIPPYRWHSGDKSMIPDSDIEEVRKLVNSVVLVTK